MFSSKFSTSSRFFTRFLKTQLSQRNRPTTSTMGSEWNGRASLAVDDPEIDFFIKEETKRQVNSLELIASENFVSGSVLEAMGSSLTNKYSAGYPGKRHYPSNQFIDEIESLCQKRALELFDLNPEQWGVNVQPYAGSPANIAVFSGLLQPHDRVMGLDDREGGHSTHGSSDRKLSAAAKFFEAMSYHLNPSTDLIDYEMLSYTARTFKPKVIVAGISTYSRLLDYKKFRQICDEVGAILMGDMAHITGMVAAKLLPSPFEYCDIITTTTHKTLRGPRAGLIFFRKGIKDASKNIFYDFEDKINSAVYPLVQGGPHNNTIAGIAVALKQANTEDYRKYQREVLKNAQVLAKSLLSKGYKLVTGGTDNHMVIVDLRPQNMDSGRVETVCKMASINLNAIGCPGQDPGQPLAAIRVGAPALTSRNFGEKDFEKAAEFLHRAIQITQNANKLPKDASSQAFDDVLKFNETIQKNIAELKAEVESFVNKFPMPGIN